MILVEQRLTIWPMDWHSAEARPRKATGMCSMRSVTLFPVCCFAIALLQGLPGIVECRGRVLTRCRELRSVQQQKDVCG